MQREVYPALILFPAETKNAISYEGDISVAGVVKFLAAYGSKSQHLINENGNPFPRFMCTNDVSGLRKAKVLKGF